MNSPATGEQSPRPGTLAFHTMVETAFKQLATAKQTAGHALRNGVNPKEIIRYATGQLTAGQRTAIQEMLAISPWATGRVTALIMAKRDPNSLGARILRGELDFYGDSADPDADLAKLLDQV